MSDMRVVDLGFMEYRKADFLQREIHSSRKSGEVPDTLILVEHPPVITIARRGLRENILLSEDERARWGIEVIEVDRGGDVTYHGPGQLVAWPIFDLRERKDLHFFLRNLESVIVRFLGCFGIDSYKVEGATGVWAKGKKIASIGIGVRGWVSYHGLSINVNPNMEHFSYIVPCGLRGKRQISMDNILGYVPEMPLVKENLAQKFSEVFNFNIVNARAACVA